MGERCLHKHASTFIALLDENSHGESWRRSLPSLLLVFYAAEFSDDQEVVFPHVVMDMEVRKNSELGSSSNLSNYYGQSNTLSMMVDMAYFSGKIRPIAVWRVAFQVGVAPDSRHVTETSLFFKKKNLSENKKSCQDLEGGYNKRKIQFPIKITSGLFDFLTGRQQYQGRQLAACRAVKSK